MIYYTSFNSPIGKIFVSKTNQGINFITWGKNDWSRYYKKNKHQLKRDDKKLKGIKDRLKKYFSGRKVKFVEKIDLLNRGTRFERKVWRNMQKIPHGQTRSYRWLAGKVGDKKSARAVGNACAKNTIPIVIPCHRVIKSDGSLGGFGGGTKGVGEKKKLLRIEKGK